MNRTVAKRGEWIGFQYSPTATAAWSVVVSTGDPPLRWEEQSSLQVITATDAPASPPATERRPPRARVAVAGEDEEVKRLQAVISSLTEQLEIVSQVWLVGQNVVVRTLSAWDIVTTALELCCNRLETEDWTGAGRAETYSQVTPKWRCI